MALIAALAPEAAVALLVISFLLGLFGFIAGIKAIKRIRRSLIKKAGLGYAIFGTVVGSLWLLYAAFMIILIGVLIVILFSL
jgi:site-specific recombinase